MLQTSFTCNSLKFSHVVRFLIRWLFPYNNSSLLFVGELSKYFNVPKENIFLFGSGRMGLYFILKSLNLQSDDEIIVAGYTCVVVSNAVKYVGAKIQYVDIDERTLNIDTDKLISAVNNKTKAIIVCHNYGIVYEDVGHIKEKFPSIFIIEDAAHAMGSLDKNRIKAGLLGDAAFFSLEYSKPITTGSGGILIINRSDKTDGLAESYAKLKFFPRLDNFKYIFTLLAHWATSYRFTVFFKSYAIGLLRKMNLLGATSRSEIEGEMPEHYPVKLSEPLAFLGYLQLKDISEVNIIKTGIAKKYHEQIAGSVGVKDFYSPNYIYVRYPVLFDDSITVDQLNQIKLIIRKNLKMAVGDWFNDVVHPKGSYRYCYVKGSCGIGEKVVKKIINLPVNIHMAPDYIKIDKLKDIFNSVKTHQE